MYPGFSVNTFAVAIGDYGGVVPEVELVRCMLLFSVTDRGHSYPQIKITRGKFRYWSIEVAWK